MTDSDFLTSTQNFYDTVANEYADTFSDVIAPRPYDRAMLGVFAEFVQAHIADGNTPVPSPRSGHVADVGSGPGRVTAHLHSLGLDIFGIDLSPAMVELAGRLHPHLSFTQGSMTRLDLADGSLSGLSAWYSTVHVPHDSLPAVYAEFFRVLEPGGYLLLAFQAGDNVRHYDEAFGHRVSIDFVRRSPTRATELLREAGFEPRSQLLCEPLRSELTVQAYLIARRPLPADPADPAAKSTS